MSRFISAVLLVTLFCLGAGLTTASAAAVYKDRNGYFAAMPPSGWTTQEYPSETIRSKVAFHNPRVDGVNIRIIAGPTPSPGYSLDDLYDESRQKINNVFKSKWPNGTYTIKKEKIGGRQAVKQRNIIPRMAAQELVTLIDNGTYYSIACNATKKSDLESSIGVCSKFVEAFLVLDPGRKFSEKEITAGMVASKKRLAELSEDMGDRGTARMYVDEGLSLDPDNEELKAMKRRLGSR